MTILLNYLYKYILESLIYTIYSYGGTQLNNNEAINYACVSTYWYQVVSESLVKNINFITFKSMKPLMQVVKFNSAPSSSSSSKPSTEYKSKNQLQQNEHQQSQVHSSFKLIKIKDSVKGYILGKSKGSTNKITLSKVIEISKVYGRVYITIICNDTLDEYIRILDKIPNNIEANITLLKGFNLFNQDYKNSFNHFNKIGRLDCSQLDYKGIYNLLSKAQPKEILYQTRLNKSNSDSGSGSLFEIELAFKSTSSGKVKIDDLIFPSKEFKLFKDQHLTSKIERFTLITTIQDMLNSVPLYEYLGYSTDSNGGSMGNGNNDNMKWQYIVNKLSTDSTLKSITYKLYTYEDIGSLNVHDINYGIKSILSNQKSIETFTISTRIPMNELLLQGLALNQSIKTLNIKSKFSIDSIIRQVLLQNRTIRNLLTTDSIGYIEWLQIFQDEQFKDQLDLYSIKINVMDQLGCFNEYLNYIISKRFNIKQFYLVKNTTSNSTPIFTQSIINNNTLLNKLEYQ